jgi:RNA polymerase sigma-70 factor (ECF subfamily)
MPRAESAPAPKSEDLTDAEVITHVLQGRQEMFELLVRRHNQRLYRIGLSYLRHPTRVEDAMQNAYLKAYLHLNTFTGASAFGTWVTRILINECLAALRSSREEFELTDEQLEQVDSGQAANHAAHLSSMHEAKALLETAVEALPPRYRVVYMMREIQQMDTAETAESTGISEEAVRVRLHRARELLKENLLASAAGAELFSFGSDHCRKFTERVMWALREMPRRP